MRKPEFEQFRAELLRGGRPLPPRARAPIRERIVALLDDTGQILVQKSRQDGRDDALVEVHGTWVGADPSVEALVESIRAAWPGEAFVGGKLQSWLEAPEDVATLEFAWSAGEEGYLTGRIKIGIG